MRTSAWRIFSMLSKARSWFGSHGAYCPAMGGLQIPRWLGSDPLSAWWLSLAPATLEFWVRFPNERNQGKQAHPVLKYRVPHGSQEVRNYLRDQAGSRSLVFDLSIAHDRFGSSSHVQQNGCLSHPQDLDAPLHIAAQRKIAAYQQQGADNQNISFLPAIVSTSTRMHWRVSASSFPAGPPGD